METIGLPYHHGVGLQQRPPRAASLRLEDVMQGCTEKDRKQRAVACELVGLRPRFEDGDVRLYQGDALDLLERLPPASVDAVITDPPYCSAGGTLSERQRDPAEKYCQNGDAKGRPTFLGDTRDQRSFAWWCTCWLRLARESTKVGGQLLVFIDWRQLPTMTDAVQAAGWTWRSIAAWNKGRGSRAPHKGYLRHQCEYIVFATNGPCVPQPGGPFDGCYTHRRRARKGSAV